MHAPTCWVNIWLLNVAQAMGFLHKMTFKCNNKLFSDFFHVPRWFNIYVAFKCVMSHGFSSNNDFKRLKQTIFKLICLLPLDGGNLWPLNVAEAMGFLQKMTKMLLQVIF